MTHFWLSDFTALLIWIVAFIASPMFFRQKFSWKHCLICCSRNLLFQQYLGSSHSFFLKASRISTFTFSPLKGDARPKSCARSTSHPSRIPQIFLLSSDTSLRTLSRYPALLPIFFCPRVPWYPKILGVILFSVLLNSWATLFFLGFHNVCI